MDNYKEGIELLEMLVGTGDGVENSAKWKGIQELKSKIRRQRQQFFKSQEESQLRQAKSKYGSIKAESLRLIAEINQDNISRSQ